MNLPAHVESVFLTGGAGFIGSHVVELLLSSGRRVTVYDNLSNGRLEFLAAHLENPALTFIKADLQDAAQLARALPGHDLVWHLAANTDIIGSHENPSRDLVDGVGSTFNVLDAMRRAGIKDLLFASTGAVYGSLCHDDSVTEGAGPLMPVSTYGAGKIASEAFISSFCNTYGLRAWMFRFGNVIGARMTHGVIFDFLNRLSANPDELLIRGDGRQEKNYFLVEECIDGMSWGYSNIALPDTGGVDVFNLGTRTISRVVDIASIVCSELGLSKANIRIEGTRLAWPGDQPRVHFSVDKINALGWQTKLTSDQSVRVAVRRMLGKIGIFETGELA